MPVTVVTADGVYRHAGTVLPAGTVLHTITELDAGFVVPRDVFPDGLPIHSHTATYTAGSIATTAIVVPRGQRIPPGTAWPDAVDVLPFLTLVLGAPHYGATPQAVMADGLVGNTGGSQPHANMPPYAALQAVIALVGIFPSRN